MKFILFIFMAISLLIFSACSSKDSHSSNANNGGEKSLGTGSTSQLESGEIILKYQGLTVNGNLELIEDKSPANGIVLLVHGTMGHNKMETIKGLQDQLKEKGINSLSFNLSLSENNRKGMYGCKPTHKHKHEDAEKEIAFWINWLETNGAKNIILLGHSRGGNQVCRYIADKNPDSVSKVVLLAPAVLDEKAAEKYNEKSGNLDEILTKAKEMIDSGKGESQLTDTDFLYCKKAKVTAASFYSYYSKENRKTTTDLLKNINKPVLMIFGSEDTILGEDVEKYKAIIEDKATIQSKEVSGADHFFRDFFIEDAASFVEEFINN